MLSFIYLASLFLASTWAHPGQATEHMKRDELIAFEARALAARKCQPQIGALLKKRNVKRDLSARASTCVAMPELTEGPYFIRDELVRNDLREDQTGIDLKLDIQLIDLDTCEPLTTGFVELWNCNATGSYAGYTAAGGTGSGGGSGGAAPSGGDSMSMGSLSMGSAPAAQSGSAGGTGGGGMATALTDASSWLRGGNFVDSNGNVTIQTIYPGFYTGRTIHIHMMVHTGNETTVNANGTIDSESGTVSHISQLFFEETLNSAVIATSPYSETDQSHTLNDEDSILAQMTAADYNPYIQVSYNGADVTDGLTAYVAVVVDTKASYNITNTNYAESFTYSAASTPGTSSTTATRASSTATASTIEESAQAAAASQSATSSATFLRSDAELIAGVFAILLCLVV